MRRITAGLLSLGVASSLAVGMSPSAAAAPPKGADAKGAAARSAPSDERVGPLEAKRRALRQQALNMVLNGKAKPERRGGSTVVKVGDSAADNNTTKAKARGHKDQYVELSREKTDRIFVVLAEFGNERSKDYPDQDTDPNTPGPQVFDGPLHNKIPAPDRSVDNSTVWQKDYSQKHYQDLYFGKGNSLKKYYEKQSSGRYSVSGEVTDWVKVKYNEARYGRSDGYPCDSNVCSNTWNLVQDAVNQWVADQKKAGRTQAQIKADLRSFDKWDRYDYDGDGNFNEPDGYIDHFQIVHAGGDQADGDPYQGEDAIWSHRWYTQTTKIGAGGPKGNPLGGSQVGDTGLWVGDYTIQPENGGVSVFAHEYGHDLGLPDNYDTAGGENAVNWWDIMAQSRVNAKKDQGLGTRAADFSSWSKIFLGWFDYEIAVAGQQKTYNLGPHEYNSKKPQGVVVVLPKKSVTTQLAKPFEGTHTWWSGQGNDLNNTMSRDVTLPAGKASLTFQANYDIEDCGPDACDYAYVEVNDGSGWKAIPGSITKSAEGNGIDGSTSGKWVPATFDLSAYAGKKVGLRMHYQTDGAAGGIGFFADAIKLVAGGKTLLEDGAEASPNGWTLDGFTAAEATITKQYDNYYIASNRSYVSYDRYLKTGPYNFGFLDSKPDYVEHFAYEPGLLVYYWDTSQPDNNTSVHPGEGLNLPIDAHPKPIYRLDGTAWRPRIQGYDAPFSLQKAHSLTLHVDSKPNYIRGQNAVKTFDDSKTYWYKEIPSHGVKVPKAGVTMTVVSVDGTSMKVRLGTNK